MNFLLEAVSKIKIYRLEALSIFETASTNFTPFPQINVLQMRNF